MRTSGVLMPIFSLPSKYGIGTLGKEAFGFVDFLNKAGQTYWQILPLGITGFGDSPYQSVSSYAGNPYFIDLELLCKEKLLNKNEVEAFDWGDNPSKVDYERLYNSRYKVLRIAFQRFKNDKVIKTAYNKFVSNNSYWLEDFALFSALKDANNGKPFYEWEDGLKLRENAYIEKAKSQLHDEMEFYKFVQYCFFSQWEELKNYANEKGIKIIGDIPIYVALDSADVWSNTKQFLLDEDLAPTGVAGCPPDAFSEEGQLWGNPLYNWEYMEQDGFDWWTKRIEFCAKIYDVVRIDHFRAFSAYFNIPAKDRTAVNGKWVKGPGIKLFDTLKEKMGEINIIAEDLGTIDDDVMALLKKTGFPGMKVLQFAFDPNSESSYLPHNIVKNCVVYTGTHDNDTAIGYLNNAPESNIKFIKNYLRISDNESFNWALIKSAMATPADTVILQMQDFLGLDNTARINTPATEQNNWQWRIGEGCVNDWLAQIIYDTTAIYFRLAAKIDESAEK